MDIKKQAERVKEQHLAAYNWQPCDPPLGLWVSETEKMPPIRFGCEDEIPMLFERQMMILEDSMEAGSDLYPVLGIKNYGPALVPSLFGAELIAPDNDVEAIENTGYWIKPLFASMEEAAAFRPEDLGSSILMDKLVKQIEYYRKNAPADIEIPVMMCGPFSTAELLRGPDIYMDMFDYPEETLAFMETCARATVYCMKQCREIAGCPPIETGAPTSFGMYYPGLRFGDDSVINLSPDMLKEFVLPAYDLMAKEFGCSFEIHCCSMPTSMVGHLVDAFLDCDTVKGISSQLGTVHYLDRLEDMKGRLSMEAGYGHGFSHFAETYGSLESWLREAKAAAAKASGLTLYSEVHSKEEAKRIMEIWKNA